MDEHLYSFSLSLHICSKRLVRKANLARITRQKKKAYVRDLERKVVDLKAQIARIDAKERERRTHTTRKTYTHTSHIPHARMQEMYVRQTDIHIANAQL